MFNVGKVTVKVDLSRYRKNVKNARFKLANQILADCKPIMPLDTGSLQQRSYVTSDNKRIVFPGPYGRYLYYGNKMVDRDTGRGPFMTYDEYGNPIGFRYKKGTKLKVKEPKQKLKFTRPNAQAKWVEAAEKEHIDEWKNLVAKEITKR